MREIGRRDEGAARDSKPAPQARPATCLRR